MLKLRLIYCNFSWETIFQRICLTSWDSLFACYNNNSIKKLIIFIIIIKLIVYLLFPDFEAYSSGVGITGIILLISTGSPNSNSELSSLECPVLNLASTSLI